MLRVFVDLEMNMVAEKHSELRAVLPHEIIEIGAVKLDENCRIIDRYRRYVRPRYNTRVHWTVQRLTGITAQTLRTAGYLEEVLPEFSAWLGSQESVRLYAWSDSDRMQVEKECTYKNLWTPELRAACAHWTDFQRVFSRMVGYRNGLALSRAIEYMGLEFDGSEHDALSDAANCAQLMALVLDEPEFARRRALVPPEPVPVRRPRKPEENAEKAQLSAAENGEGEPGAAGAAPPHTGKRRRRRRKKTPAEKAAPAGESLQTGSSVPSGLQSGAPAARASAAPDPAAAAGPEIAQSAAAGNAAAPAKPAAKRRRRRRRRSAPQA